MARVLKSEVFVHLGRLTSRVPKGIESPEADQKPRHQANLARESTWNLPHWKLTYPLKSMVGRCSFLLKWSLFRGHVNFRGGISSLICSSSSICIFVLHQVNLQDSQKSPWISLFHQLGFPWNNWESLWSDSLTRIKCPDNGMSNPTN